jgi:putative heme-binding domain-containing protein
MQAELIAAVGDKDAALALRAINALKPLDGVEKSAALRRVALNPAVRESNRIAALRALAPGSSAREEILLEVLQGNGSNALRRAAADLLGTATSDDVARTALIHAFPTASADVALTLATALARSDPGAAELIDLAASGKVRPALLRHRHVMVALEKRPAELRERVAALTRALPPEDARLDALIAQRLAAWNTAKTDSTRGAHVFTQHCAACHKMHEAGGSLGPGLDGITSRNPARVIEDILDPNRNIDPAFRLHTITLKDGSTKSGMNFREESGRVFLIDPATTEKLEIARDDVSEIATSPASPMPAAFDTLLSEQDFFDLLAFIRSPSQ